MSVTDPHLSFVLPAYREKENLAILIPQIEDGFRDTVHEIIVVDDGSKDGTRELLERFNTTYGNIVLIERAGLMGIGSALRDGYNKARGTYIISSDADCAFSVADMRALFAKIHTGDDLVLGYKLPGGVHDEATHGGWSVQGWLENHVTSPLSNRIIGLITGMGYKNYNTNFRAIRTSLWKRLKPVEDRQFFLFEVLLGAKRANAKITEVPVNFSSRQAGESKISFFKQAPSYLYKLIRITYLNRGPN